MPGFCEHGNEFMGPIRGEERLAQLSDYQLLKEELVTATPAGWFQK
jgi:hypothetical protein